jgi:hypothetical protein
MKKVYRMSLSSMKSIKVINNDNAILMSKLINIKRNKLIKFLFSFDLPFLTSLKWKILLLNIMKISYLALTMKNLLGLSSKIENFYYQINENNLNYFWNQIK